MLATSPLETTTAASNRSPEARRTASTFPSATSISSARLSSRSVPPSSSKSRTSPLTSAPVPPIAKWTPQVFSRKWIIE